MQSFGAARDANSARLAEVVKRLAIDAAAARSPAPVLSRPTQTPARNVTHAVPANKPAPRPHGTDPDPGSGPAVDPSDPGPVVDPSDASGLRALPPAAAAVDGEVVAYGEWPSPISAADVAQAAVQLSDLCLSDGCPFWLEARPANGGKVTLVRYANGEARDVSAPTFNVRSRVHEFEGAPFVTLGDLVVASEYTDQKLYVLAVEGSNKKPRVLPSREGSRYADGVFAEESRALFFVCEARSHVNAAADPAADPPVNSIVRLKAGGGQEVVVESSTRGCYLSPRVSPNEIHLAFVEYQHPHMPWDESSLWVRNLRTGDRRLVCGGIGAGVSTLDPLWLSDDVLCYVSDALGWWNLYAYRLATRAHVCLLPVPADCASLPCTFRRNAAFAKVDTHTLVLTFNSKMYLLDISSALATLSALGVGEQANAEFSDLEAMPASLKLTPLEALNARFSR